MDEEILHFKLCFQHTVDVSYFVIFSSLKFDCKVVTFIFVLAPFIISDGPTIRLNQINT